VKPLMKNDIFNFSVLFFLGIVILIFQRDVRENLLWFPMTFLVVELCFSSCFFTIK